MAKQYLPSTGESPLANLPQYGGAGGGQQAAEYYAARDFVAQFGRNPTQSEIAMLAPAYLSGDPNRAGLGAGKAAIAQYFQSVQNTPANQYAQQQAQYEADAPQHYDAINQMYQSTLGRDATDAEKKHFGSLLASGQVDQYGVGQFLQALPETVRKQDEAFRNQLSGTLQKQDAQYFNEQIMPSIQSQFAQQGRDVRSSGFANSLAQAATQQNRQREGFLSNLSASQYGNQQGLAQNAYNQTYGAYTGLQDYSRQRAAQLQDATQGRINDLADYDKQARMYNDYLARYGKRGGWVSDLGTALNYANSFANIFKGGGGGGGGGGSSLLGGV